MPRRSRIVLPGAAIHAIQRGNNRADCFFADEDRAFYLFHLARLLPRAGCRLHAYCLMTNHVHLLLSAAEAEGCSLLMKGIAQLYTQYVNKTYGRCGTLWEGRFKSCLVQSEVYVLACYRYVELNPVRAGMVRRPDEYPWSSFAVNAKGDSSQMLSPHDEYSKLGRTPAEQQAAYRDLFGIIESPALLAEIRNATNGGYALGNASFKRMMSRVLGRRVERGHPGRPVRKPVDDHQPDLLTPK